MNDTAEDKRRGLTIHRGDNYLLLFAAIFQQKNGLVIFPFLLRAFCWLLSLPLSLSQQTLTRPRAVSRVKGTSTNPITVKIS